MCGKIVCPIVFSPQHCVERYANGEDCLNRVWFRKHIDVKKKRGLTKAEASRRSKNHEAPILVSSCCECGSKTV